MIIIGKNKLKLIKICVKIYKRYNIKLIKLQITN